MGLAFPAFGQAAKSLTQTAPRSVPWTQWGGPNRNFQTEASGLRDSWPASGPRVMWKRTIGEGYSSTIVEDNSLYTMYGKRGEEVVLAANAQTGTTVWEHTTPMTFESDAGREMGNGPYATPLVVGDRLFTAGVAGRLQCFDKKTGKLLWTQQLWSDHGGSRLMYGYSSSPLAFRETIIMPVGGTGKALMAFNQADGKVAWSRQDLGNVYSSPLLINVIEKATFVWADQKLITLDQDGNLMIAHPSTQGFKISAKAPLLTHLSWTPPVLVGTRLYIRDRRNMMAVDLS